jgi:hypothetical protein
MIASPARDVAVQQCERRYVSGCGGSASGYKRRERVLEAGAQ